MNGQQIHFIFHYSDMNKITSHRHMFIVSVLNAQNNGVPNLLYAYKLYILCIIHNLNLDTFMGCVDNHKRTVTMYSNIYFRITTLALFSKK